MKQAKKKINMEDVVALKKKINFEGLNTVCQEAKCPNIGECFKKKVVTFLILGKYCSRGCSFCAIEKRDPEVVDMSEPYRVAEAIKMLGLSYSVITSVTRDDLCDGGARHFAETVNAIKVISPSTKIEVLVPDFLGDTGLINIVLNSIPDIFSHNLETVYSMYNRVMKEANYDRSLSVLKYAKSIGFKVKTGIMLGFGETEKQIFEAIEDVRSINVDILTIGQYLAPTKKHYSVVKEYTSKEFKIIKDFAVSIGIKQVISGRYVRSSYLTE
jgi:lipoic acid synthetase